MSGARRWSSARTRKKIRWHSSAPAWRFTWKGSSRRSLPPPRCRSWHKRIAGSRPSCWSSRRGRKCSFPNNDPIFRNVFSLSGPRTFDLGNYPKGDTRIVAFPEPGIVYVNCHLHSNMTATIVVAPNRWNARADRDGRFELPDVPPGKYTIVAWHKAAGFFRQPVVVAAGRDEHVEFLIPVDENGRRIDAARLATVKLQAGRE